MNHKEFNYPKIKPEYLEQAQYRIIHPMQKTIAIGTAVVIVAMVLLIIVRLP